MRTVATLSHVRARRECVQQWCTLRSETFSGLVLRVAGLRLGLAEGETTHQRHKHQVQNRSENAKKTVGGVVVCFG